MPEVDLGDRSELIDFIYGPPKEGTVSAAHSAHSLNKEEKNALNKDEKASTVVRENGTNERREREGEARQVRQEVREVRAPKKEKKKAKKIACSCCTICCLLLLAALAIAAAGFGAYWFTRQEYENRLSKAKYTPLTRRNMTMDEYVPLEEDAPEKEVPTPTLEQMKLPENVKPLGYDISLKVPLKANSSIKGNARIRLEILEETDKIVFNGKGLVLPSSGKFRILTEPKRKLRRRDTETPMNSTEESSAAGPEEVAEMPEEEETMNSQELIQEIKETKPLQQLVPAGVNVAKAEQDDDLEKITLTLDKKIGPGEVVLQFPFESKLSDSPSGPYLTSYKNSDGTTSTGFTLAGSLRKLFPSFDEERFAAPLKLSVIHPKDTIAVTNGPDGETKETDEPGWVETTIDKESAGSTTLNIFNFDKLQNEAKNDNEIRVWARPDAMNSTAFALEQAVKIANMLQDFYDTSLPTKTLDIIAVPGLLVGQSVPGQIQVPESSILYDPSADDVVDKVRIVQELSQLINKQFIGNIVPETDSKSEWIEEAMSHFVVKNALDSFFGSSDPTNQHILVNSVEKALSLDSQSSSHPLTADRETVHESTIINDIVSKEKGAAVLRMVQYVMGRDAFRKGIRDFFATTTKGNSSYTDLWKSLQKEVPSGLKAWDDGDFDVANFANKWVQQMGYPVVDVYRLDPQNVELTQRRFKLDKITHEQSKFRNAVYWYKWDIPLNYWVNGDVKDMKWLHEAARLSMNISDDILINGNAEGYYRVNYDEESWGDIAKIFNHEHGLLSASARGRVLSDVFALAAANDIPYKIPFNVTEYLPNEDAYAPIAVALDGLLNIYNRLDDSEEATKAKKYILQSIEKQFKAIPDFNTLTSQDKSDYLKIKRDVAILEAYCRLSHEKCRKQFASLSEDKLITPCMDSNFSSQCSTVPPTLRALVYCDAVAYGDDGIFNSFIHFARNEPVASERKRLVQALGCSRDPLAIRRLLKNSLSNDTQLARDDIPVFLCALSSSDVGSLVISDFLLDNWKELRERLSDDVYTISTALTNGLRPNNRRQIKLLETFAQEHPSAKSFGSFRNQLEKGRSTLEWQRKNSEELSTLFKEL